MSFIVYPFPAVFIRIWIHKFQKSIFYTILFLDLGLINHLTRLILFSFKYFFWVAIINNQWIPHWFTTFLFFLLFTLISPFLPLAILKFCFFMSTCCSFIHMGRFHLNSVFWDYCCDRYNWDWIKPKNLIYFFLIT